MGGLSRQELLAELTENNSFFDMIVDMIPSKLYIAGQSGDDFNPKNRFFKDVSQGSKEARKAAAKVAKRRKLDPSRAESTVEQKGRLEHEKLKEQRTNELSSEPTVSTKTSTDSQEKTQPSSPHQSRIEALRSKLHAKIAEKQGNRPNPNQVSKRAARRAEKLRRKEEAIKRKRMAGTKVDTGNNNKTKKVGLQLGKGAAAADDLADLDFGRLSGLNAHQAKNNSNYLADNKALANLSKPKNLKKMLADAEARQQKLEDLQRGSAEDKAKAAEMQWTDTFKEADGQRVKTNPAKIKKILKRQAAKKQKSQKAWKSRMDQVAAQKDERQKIRNHNLKARQQGGALGANLSKKKIVTAEDLENDKKEKGKRSRAGFEGKKKEFINKKKTGTTQ